MQVFTADFSDMKRVLFIVVLIASLLVIRSLVVSIYTLWQKQDLMVQTQDRLKKEKERNRELQERIIQAQSPLFIEEQARNKLFMGREGEQEIIVSQRLLGPNSTQSASASVSNLQQWINLFF